MVFVMMCSDCVVARVRPLYMVDGSWRSAGRDLPSRHEGEALLLGIKRGGLFGGGLSLLGGLLGLGRSLLLSLFGRRSGLGLRGGFGGGGRSRGFVAARERDGTDESGGGGGEKLGVECHDVVGVQLLAVSVLLLRALSYMYAVSRMAVRPTGLPSLRFPSFVR